MNSESPSLPDKPSYAGATASWRFHPYVSTAGLEPHLKLRSFVGYHPEDTLQCRAAAWVSDTGLSVVLSPAPGLAAPALAQHFERLASLYFLELVARGLARSGQTIRWLQHWPARTEAPAPHDQDRFEQVLFTPWDSFSPRGSPPRMGVSPHEALAGFYLEPTGHV